MSACMSVTSMTHLFACVSNHESVFLFVCFLQIFKAKENHLDLIQELRTVNALQTEEQELQKADKELTKTLAKQRDKSRHKVKYGDIIMYDI